MRDRCDHRRAVRQKADRAENSDHHRRHELWRAFGASEGSAGPRRVSRRHLHHHRRRRHDAEEREHSKILVYQVLPSRYGMNPDDLRKADAIEVVVGQGAKPGGGGMLLGQKITTRVAEMRRLPEGIDQRSACRHPDWTGPDDLEIKIHELREITDWEKPVYVKVGASRPYYDTALAVKSGRRCHRARRHARRHGGDPGCVHRKCRSADSFGDRARGTSAAGTRHASQGPAHCLRRHPQRCRCGESAWRWAPMPCRSAPRL